MENRRDLTINGVARSSGGVFYRARIEGVARVDGDVDCIALAVNGKAKIRGNVKTKSADIHGLSQIAGDLASDKVNIHGSARIGGNLTGERIELHGSTSVSGNCEAETFTAHGRFRIDGLLNAGRIDIHLYGPCKVREIGGEIIRVRKTGSPVTELIRFLFRWFSFKLTTETIEGDEIHLEYTRAKVVRGNTITIGPGCEIDLVESKHQFHQDKSAKVKVHKSV